MKNAVRVSLASRIGASVEKKLKKPDRFFVYGVANLPFFFGLASWWFEDKTIMNLYEKRID